MPGRVEIDNVQPVVSCGAYPAKAVVGEVVPVSAAVWREGHEAVAATLVVRYLGTRYPQVAEMRRIKAVQAPETSWPTREPPDPIDRRSGSSRCIIPMTMGLEPYVFHGQFTPDRVGLWTFRVDGWGDPIHTWRHGLVAKLDAGQGEKELSNDLLVGAALFERAATGVPRAQRDPLLAAAAALRTPGDPVTRTALALAPDVEELLIELSVAGHWSRAVSNSASGWIGRWPASARGTRCFRDRPAAGTPTASRCTAPSPPRPRRFRASPRWDSTWCTCRRSIRSARYTARAATTPPPPRPGDVGSPWAIGSDEGGHDAVHPSLGTIDDFDDFVAAARDLGMEVALDLALQCAPDHPWAREHRQWFTELPDGTIAYAENPPKKYQDIYPLNFDNDPAGLYDEVLRVVRHWIDHGIKFFRVDNPHTKPPDFWAWLIGQVKADRSRRALPVRGLHSAGPPVRAGQARLHAVLQLLHLAHRQVGAHRVRQRHRRTRRLPPAEPVRQHPRHPARDPAAQRPRHVRHPRGAGGDHEPGLGRVLGLRAVRAPRGARGQRGVPGFGEVRTAPPRLRGRARRRQSRWSRSSPSSTQFAGCIRRCSSCAPSISTTSTTTRCWPTASSTRPPATACWWW